MSEGMEFYINVDNKKQGPYSVQELAVRGIEATTLVLATNSSEWKPAWQVDELRLILMGNKSNNAQQSDNKRNILDSESVLVGAPVDEIPHVNAQPIDDVYERSVTLEKPKKHYGCLIGFLISLVVLTCLLIFTCPSAEEHKRVLSDVVTATVTETAVDAAQGSDNALFSKALQTVNDMFTKKVIDAAMENLISVDNNFVYSIGRINFGGKSYIVSFGVLNHVFTLNKDQLKLATEKYYKKAEFNVQSDLQKKAEKLLKENVIDPAAKEIEKMAGSAIDELLDGLGFGLSGKSKRDNSDLLEDSI